MKPGPLSAALLAVVPAPAVDVHRFAGMCKALARRKSEHTIEWYVGAVQHLVGKYDSEVWLREVLVVDRSDANVDALREAARMRGDRDGVALADLLLTLTEKQREGL